MFSAISHIWRLGQVGATFERTGAMTQVLDALGAPMRMRAALRLFTLPGAIFGARGDKALPPVARALTALGPSYVKLGQVLSTRPDMVGEALADELRYLQDRLPEFPMAEARRIIRAELGASPDDLFDEFGPPVAAASIAQVHPAREKGSGRKLAVKILRPGIERAFRRDIDAFHFAARLLERLAPASRRLRPTAMIAHFDSVVTLEMDLLMEAAAASEFRDNIADDEGFRVPAPIWRFSARRVLTSEWVSGVPMGDSDGLRAAGFDMPQLAERVIQSFLLHALRDGYFHADMHQGNLKVGEDGAVLALDFGIMGRLDPLTRRFYAEILLGFLQKDYARAARAHKEAGYLPPDADETAFAQAMRAVAEPIFGQDASRISIGRLLARLFEVTERFGMETRTELILLQRTMIVVEGVARSLDPQSNMWSAAKPVVENWMRDNLGPESMLRDMRDMARTLTKLGPRLPILAERLILAADRPDTPPPAPTHGRMHWAGMAIGTAAGAAIGAGGAVFALRLLG